MRRDPFNIRGLASCFLLLAAAGCEKTSSTANKVAPSNASTSTQTDSTAIGSNTQPAATQASALLPASAEPSNAAMLIDQKRQEFPPAILVLHNKLGKLTALLYSDDPKDAIKDDYVGNGFYVQMPLDIDDTSQIDGATWQFSSSSSEREDSPFGIFLRGSRQRLQPQNVNVQFTVTDKGLIVWMSGTWMLFDDDDADNTPPRLVPVTTKLRPSVREKMTKG